MDHFVKMFHSPVSRRTLLWKMPGASRRHWQLPGFGLEPRGGVTANMEMKGRENRQMEGAFEKEGLLDPREWERLVQ